MRTSEPAVIRRSHALRSSPVLDLTLHVLGEGLRREVMSAQTVGQQLGVTYIWGSDGEEEPRGLRRVVSELR